MLLDGLHIPLTTPFHPDGRLNTSKLASNVARYSKTPAAGLLVLGPNAEPSLLSDDETRQLLRTVAEAAAPEKVLLAGIVRDSVHATLELAAYAATLLYDAILVGIPTVLADIVPSPDEDDDQASAMHLWQTTLLTHLRTIADRSPLPVILLATDIRPIPPAFVIELATHPNILGLLDTGSDPTQYAQFEQIARETASVHRDVTVTPIFAAVTARMLQAASRATRPALVSAASLTGGTALAEPPPLAPALRTRTKAVGFQLLAGGSTNMLASLHYGAVGIAPAFAACAPQACYEVLAAHKDADHDLADEKQVRLRAAARFAESLGPGGLKCGCDLNGYFGGLPRLPLLSPAADYREALEDLMQPMRN